MWPYLQRWSKLGLRFFVAEYTTPVGTATDAATELVGRAVDCARATDHTYLTEHALDPGLVLGGNILSTATGPGKSERRSVLGCTLSERESASLPSHTCQ